MAAFATKVASRGLALTGLDWAFTHLDDAHINSPDERVPYDAVMLQAAQWILWFAQILFSHLALGDQIGSSSFDDAEHGEYQESLAMKRWHAWRFGFRRAAICNGGENLQRDDNSFGYETWTEKQSTKEAHSKKKRWIRKRLKCLRNSL